MGMITEMQMQAARYANPLTQLPGSVPINEHIDRLLEHRIVFHACYFDIDCFKPFNDVFGYRKGDDIIALLAHTLTEVVNPLADFCGHIGGDDFMVLFQSSDWESRCHHALQLFDLRIQESVSPELLTDNGYFAENRRGQMDFHSLPCLSIEPSTYRATNCSNRTAKSPQPQPKPRKRQENHRQQPVCRTSQAGLTKRLNP